ncbi:MAG: hypothetical protein K8R92_03400 [Planctomycetes bacterium]|nr:hypothetical protein [Planctomycetota bacterium]
MNITHILTNRKSLACGLIASAFAAQASASLITFTGGTVTRLDATTETTNNSVLWDNVDYYEEGGFRLDFTPNSGSAGFATNVGNYYGAGNDVIHAHWATGSFGGVEAITISKVGGGTFDLNFFSLTSNTATGGSAASGTELAWVEGFNGATSMGFQLLPSEDWGFPSTYVFLGSNFDNVDKVVFYVTNHVDCFGMDDFYIDEVPGPGGLAMGLIFGGMMSRRRR